MAWHGEAKRHSAAAFKAWKTKRASGKYAAKKTVAKKAKKTTKD